MKTCLAALLLSAIVSSPALAQPTVQLTLDEATARAVAHLPDVAIHRGAVRLARAAESQAAAAFDPVVRLDSRVRSRTDPLNTLFSGAPEGALAPRITSLGGTASWSKLFTGGATVIGQTSATTERTNSLFALLTPAYLTSAAVELRQPLVQGRRTDAARQRVRVTGLDTARSRARLQQTVLDLVAAVEQAYWTLGAAREDVAVRRRVLALAEAQRGEVLTRIEAGTAAERDVATSDAAIASRRTDLIMAAERATRAELALKQLTAGTRDDPLWGARLELIDTPSSPAPLPPIDALVSEALTARPEVDDLEAQAARAALDETLAADRLRPRVDLVAGYALRGLAGRENSELFVPFPGGTVVVPEDLRGVWGQTLRNTLGHRFADASAGVAVTLPLGNRAARADLTTAAIAREQLEHMQRAFALRVTHDVRLAAAQLEAAGERRGAAAEAREAATRQLAAEHDRDAAGLSSAFLLLTRQTDLAQAESSEIAARADEALALTSLERVTGRLLDRRGIDVGSDGGSPATAGAPAGPLTRETRR